MSGKYKLNFVIPAGPTGPAGSSSSINVYGGRYNNTASTINLTVGTQTQVPLSINMPSQNTTYTTPNSIIVSQGGVYEINYYLNISVSVATTLTLSIRNNATNIASTIMTRTLSVGNNSIYSGSTLVTLTANSVIDMTMSALVALGVNLSNGVNASLTVKKIS